MKKKHTLYGIIFILITTYFVSLLNAQGAAVYYIDFEKGKNSFSGTKPEAAWKNAPGDPDATGNPAKIKLQAGDTLLFKGGVVYRGGIFINFSGTPGKPIIFKGDGWGKEKAILEGTKLLQVDIKSCKKAGDCYGNPNWKQIYYVALKEDIDIKKNILVDSQILHPAQDPNQPDPFFFDNLANFRTISLKDKAVSLTKNSITDPSYFIQDDPHYWDNAYLAVWMIPNLVHVLKIIRYDPDTATVTFENPPKGPPEHIYDDRDSFYAVMGSVHHIDRAGEYAYDKSLKRLYFWPEKVIDPQKSRIAISIKGLSAFLLPSQSHIVIEGFKIINYENSGISHKEYRKVVDEITVRNNKFHFANIFLEGRNIRILNNELQEIANRPIIIFGSNATVKGNRIMRSRGTAIYFAGVKNGYILDNTITNIEGVHANGITTYQACWNILIANNKISHASSPITFQDSANLYFVNNIIDGNNRNNNVNEWSNTQKGPWAKGVIAFFNNTIVNSHNGCAVNIGKDKEKTYIAKNNIIDGGFSALNINRSHNIYTSLCWNQSSRYGWTLLEGESVHDKTQLFVDTGKNDFHLSENSPAILSGDDIGKLIPHAVFSDFDFTLDIEANQRNSKKPCIGAYSFLSRNEP